MEHKLPPIIPGNFYHFHNRSSGHQKLFVSEENFHFFLEKYRHYFSNILDTYAYVLMPEHFHFLVKVKSEGELVAYFSKNRSKLEALDTMLNEQFTELFSAYSKSFNKKQNHKGELFLPLVKRKKITNTDYLRDLVRYMHLEPVQAGLVKQVYAYTPSSYAELLSGGSLVLKPAALYELFTSEEAFERFHQEKKSDFHFNFMEES